jgi:hypothetical protein
MNKTINVYQKLAAIQQEIAVPKTHYNKFGDYYFRNTEDILKAIKPLLAKYQASIIISDELIITEKENYIKAIVKFIDIETGEIIENTSIARETETRKKMASEQLTGSASSYSRKYALSGLLLLDDNKDADHPNIKETVPQKIQIVKEAKKQVTRDYLTILKIKGIITQLSQGDPDEMLQFFDEYMLFNKITGVKSWMALKGKQIYFVYEQLSKDYPEEKKQVKEYLESMFEVKKDLLEVV